MTEATLNLWDGMRLEQVTDDYIHLGTEYGPSLMVLNHLPAGGPYPVMSAHFCDLVGQLLLMA